MTEKRSGIRQVLYTAAACMVAAAIALLVWQFIEPRADGGTKTIEVQVVHGDSSTQDFTLTTQKATLGEALVEGDVVVDDQGSYGLYIQTADGETVNGSAQEWWKITKGGESVNTGADSTPIADGEHYELTFTVGY